MYYQIHKKQNIYLNILLLPDIFHCYCSLFDILTRHFVFIFLMEMQCFVDMI